MPAVRTTRKLMKMDEIKAKARSLGIEPGKMKKTDLIRMIQQWEGNTPCFGTSRGECTNEACCFIGDCLKIKT